MTEAQTRASLIDKRLLASGWDVSDHTKVVKEYTLKNNTFVNDSTSLYTSNQFSDYVLLGRDGKPLAVVEAKRTSKDAELELKISISIMKSRQSEQAKMQSLVENKQSSMLSEFSK